MRPCNWQEDRAKCAKDKPYRSGSKALRRASVCCVHMSFSRVRAVSCWKSHSLSGGLATASAMVVLLSLSSAARSGVTTGPMPMSVPSKSPRTVPDPLSPVPTELRSAPERPGLVPSWHQAHDGMGEIPTFFFIQKSFVKCCLPGENVACCILLSAWVYRP